MDDYPDINDLSALAKAVAAIDVLGGYSRSFTIDASGDVDADRYVERLGDYLSEFAIRSCLERAFKHAHAVHGVDGIISAQSRDEITITYSDDTDATFRRVSEDARLQKAERP